MSSSAFIGFGSNLGDRMAQFDRALEALKKLPETSVVRHSRLYETVPKGLSDSGGPFINAVVEIETELAPEALMTMMREVETRLGKSSDHRSDLSRAIDLDLLLYGDVCTRNADLEIPHPRLHHRAFVLVPLAEIAPHTLHPGFRRSMADLLRQLPVDELREVRAVAERRPVTEEA